MKLYLSDHNLVLDSLRHHHEVRETSLLASEAVVLWQDYRGLNRDITMFANSIGIPTLVMQHGFNQTIDYAPPSEGKPAQFPLFASTAMVWGDAEKERMINSGYNPGRIKVTGCPIFDKLPERKPHSGVNVVFFPVKWDREITENYSVLRTLLETGRYNVTSKLLSGQFDEKRFSALHEKYGGAMMVTSPDREEHLESIYELLETADVFVMPWDTTAALFAYCMDIPVVFADVVKPRSLLKSRGKYIFKPSEGGLVADSLSRLPAMVDSCIEHPEVMHDERMETARRYASVDKKGTALERVLETVRDSIAGSRTRSIAKLFYISPGPAEPGRINALSDSLVEMLGDKGERSLRCYSGKIAGAGTACVMESVYGFNDQYMVALVPRSETVPDLPFAEEGEVSRLVGRNASPVAISEFEALVHDEMLDVIFDMNYPETLAELKGKAVEYKRMLKNKGELHLSFRNPRALKSRIKESLGLENHEAQQDEAPSISRILEIFESAKLSLRKYEAVHPEKMYISVDTPEAKMKMKMIGSVYRVARSLAPDSAASFFTAVFVK